MRRFTRFIALLLVFACLLACMVACNKPNSGKKPIQNNNGGSNITNNNNGNSNNNNSNNSNHNNNSNTEDTGIPMPAIRDFGAPGDPYVYKALVRTGDPSVTVAEQLTIGNNGYACIDFWVDGEPTNAEDAIQYAVYLRNSRIEENYNCRIQQDSQQGDMTSQLRLAYLNDDKYDLTIILAKAAASAATQNLLSNLNNMPTLDLLHPSYDQKSIKELALGDSLYYLSGDMNVSTLEVCGPTLVNMDLYDEYLDAFVELFDNPLYADIYNLVIAKKWTIDTMLKMATTINVDVDDSDRQALGSQPGDVLGYFAYTGMGVYYFYGSGGRLTELDEEGNVTLSIEKYNDLFDYLFDKFNTKEGSNAGWLPTGYSDPRWNIFSSGRCLFTEMTLFDIRAQLYGAKPFKYGILPNPTYEEGTDYNSVVYFTNCNHLWAIPNKFNNSEVAQQMMNIFAAYSNSNFEDSTMYAYYTRTLYFTTAPDAGSREVMDIIKNSMVYDIALLYDWEKMGSLTLGELTIGARGVYANNVSKQNDIKKVLDDTVEQLKNPLMIK